MPRKTDQSVCFPCAQKEAPTAHWQRVEAFGRTCTQCGERPQGLFVKLVGSKDKDLPVEHELIHFSDKEVAVQRTESEQLEHEALDRAIFESLQTSAVSHVERPISEGLQPTSSSEVSQGTNLDKSLSTEYPSSGGRESNPSASSLSWLADWLESLGLRDHFEEAATWCDSMGAVEVDEILENVDDFAEHLQLSNSEREQLTQVNNAIQPGASTAVSAASAEHEQLEEPWAEGAATGPVSEACTFGPTDAQYIILEQLGRGATATVYKCQRGQEFFAAKAIDLQRFRMLQNYELIMEMLNREISLLWTLHHRRIVRLHDVVDTPSKRFLVLDLMDGGDLLHHILAQDGRGLAEAEARHIFLQIIDGLRYIHSKNVVHRDLKPDNILIDAASSRQGMPEVKLSDFGFSKQIRDGYTRPHTVLGTPQYWAPEVSQAGESSVGYDERADLWSLGIVLYVMLMGKYPFSTGSAGERREGFPFRGSRDTEELVRGLIRLLPADRLSIEQCLASPWLAHMKPPKLSTEPSMRLVLVRLPCAPPDVGALKSALSSYSSSHKISASLHLLDVVVSFPPGSSDSLMNQTKVELFELVSLYVPELRKHDEGELLQAPFNEARAEECESLGSIYDQDFEAISSIEWKIQLQDGIVVHVYLPPGYPSTQPPKVEVECPMFVLPAGLTTSLCKEWTPGSVCIYEWVEHIRDRLAQELPLSDPQSFPLQPPADVQGSADQAQPSADKTFEFNPSNRGARGQRRQAKKFSERSADPCYEVKIHTVTPLEDRKSVFRAHGAHVTSGEQVEWVWRQLLSDKKIQNAQHNFVAFRYKDCERGKLMADCDSDREDRAGGMLADLLEHHRIDGVFVMVSRWYGGQPLGADRFKNMTRVALKLLEEMQLVQSAVGPTQKTKRHS